MVRASIWENTLEGSDGVAEGSADAACVDRCFDSACTVDIACFVGNHGDHRHKSSSPAAHITETWFAQSRVANTGDAKAQSLRQGWPRCNGGRSVMGVFSLPSTAYATRPPKLSRAGPLLDPVSYTHLRAHETDSYL
eukprot:4967674-Pleurochrysis_carterae.AAC.1